MSAEAGRPPVAGAADRAGEALRQLGERLLRHPPDRYPVQHATAQFHLGLVLAGRGDLNGAEAALATAARLFGPRALPGEHGKAMNALGAVLRLSGRPLEASEIFARAAAAFAAAGLETEEAMAHLNRGLVLADADELRGATAAYARAARMASTAGAEPLAARALRELGAARLALGELASARDALGQALAVTRGGGDVAGAGIVANVLGLVELADGRADVAAQHFAASAAAHGRGLLAEDHAMAKANLALAHEALGQAAWARLAARQALAVGSAPPVRAQAEEILARLGAAEGDLAAVLDAEERTGWAAAVRDELARWVDAAPEDRAAGVADWVDGLLARPRTAVSLAEAWIGGLLELPPAELEVIARAVHDALGGRDAAAAERFRAHAAMAAARFHVPQLMRLRHLFNRIAVERGEEPAWS